MRCATPGYLNHSSGYARNTTCSRRHRWHARARSMWAAAGCLLSVLTLITLGACAPHDLQGPYQPTVAVDEEFSNAGNANAPGRKEGDSVRDASPATDAGASATPWYRTFNDDALTRLVTQALTDNLDLRQAWQRLRQAELTARIAGSTLYPQLSAGANANTQYSDTQSTSAPAASASLLQGNWSDSHDVSANLNWQLDLWGKIRAGAQAEEATTDATRADMDNTALLLSSNIVRTYFDLQTQQALRQRVEEQITTNRQFLELTVWRKATGQGTILDVQEQEQQLLATQAELSDIASAAAQHEHTLALLLGQSPVRHRYTPQSPLPELPPLPDIGTPEALLQRHPLVRAAYARLKAADHTIAAQLAEQLPDLSITSSYQLSSAALGSGLENTVFSAVASLTQSLFDAGRRAYSTERSREAFKERLYGFTQTYLTALKDVEDALAKEKYAREKLESVHVQRLLAKKNLTEAQYQYSNGTTDYLRVLTILSQLHTLERQEITAKRTLLDARVALHVALGSPVPFAPEPAEATEAVHTIDITDTDTADTTDTSTDTDTNTNVDMGTDIPARNETTEKTDDNTPPARHNADNATPEATHKNER